MSIPLITAGFILLLNPCVWLWDIFPDLIGAILIMIGMRKIAYINDTSENVNSNLIMISMISAFKLALGIILRDTPGMTKVLLSFVFAVLECIYLLRLYKSFFSLFDLLQMRFCDERETTPFVVMESAGKVLSIYTVVRLVVGFLPEIVEFRPGMATVGGVMSSTKRMLYVFAAALTAVGFIAVSVYLIRAMKKFAADRATPKNAIAESERIRKADVAEWYSRIWRFNKRLLAIATVFSIFFFADWVDIFPKVIAAIFLAFLTILCAENRFAKVMAVVTNVLLGVTSVICTVRMTRFFTEYKNALESDEYENRLALLVMRNSEAKQEYITVAVLMALVGLLLFASYLLMTDCVKKTRLRELEEAGRKGPRLKKLSIQILVLRILASLAGVAAAAFPFVRLVFPEFFVILVVLGAATALWTYFVDLVD